MWIVFWCVRIPTHHVHPSSKDFRVHSFWNIHRSRQPWRHLKRSGLSIWLQRSVLVLWHRALQCCKILHPATPQWKGQHIRAAQQMLFAKGRNISTFATCGWLCSRLNGFKLQPNAKDQKDQLELLNHRSMPKLVILAAEAPHSSLGPATKSQDVYNSRKDGQNATWVDQCVIISFLTSAADLTRRLFKSSRCPPPNPPIGCQYPHGRAQYQKGDQCQAPMRGDVLHALHIFPHLPNISF